MVATGVKDTIKAPLQGFVERLIPPFIYKYLYRGRGGGLRSNKRGLYVTKPMTWEAFCYIWVPEIFPEVMTDLEVDAFPPSYRKACAQLLAHIFDISETSAQRIVSYQTCRYGLPSSYGQLLRKTHMLWSFDKSFTLSEEFMNSLTR